MFRVKLSKFKQIFAVAIIPRSFLRDTKPIKNKLNHYTLDVFSIAKKRKSTDSGSKDDEIEKQRQIIDKCFGETPHASESKDLNDDASEMEKEHKSIVKSEYVQYSDAEKYDISNAPDNVPIHATSEVPTDEATVHATTANVAEETLAQRVETIDETPHVEASPQKIEGFNSTPKVLGHDIEFFADEKIQKIDLDDLAKRCVGAPIGNIDEMLIQEMKNMANNDIKSQTDMNLIKSHGVEKYYSGIFEHFSQTTKKTQNVDDTPKEPLHLFYENQVVGENEMKSEPITPLHIDGVHLFAINEGSKGYMETEFFQDSSVHLSSEIKEPLLDIPSIITPYESPAIPFYEYVNKELIILGDIDENERMTITETATDARSEADNARTEEDFLRKEEIDVPGFLIEKDEMGQGKSEPTLSPTAEPILVDNARTEEDFLRKEEIDVPGFVIEKDEMGQGKSEPTLSPTAEPILVDNARTEEDFLKKEEIDVPGFVIEKDEMGQGKSEPTLSPTAEPILVDSMLKGNNIRDRFGNLSREQLLKLLNFYKKPTVNKTEKSYLFSKSEETLPEMNSSPNSSISSTFLPEAAHDISNESNQNLEMPVNTAISAHQDPGEYYNMVFLNEQQASNLSVAQQTLTAENHIIHAFCTQLQEMQDDVSKETEDVVTVLEYPILLRDPFSYIIYEPKIKENSVSGALHHATMRSATAKTIENVTHSIKKNITSADDGIPLSQMLKRIRAKNRLEFYRNLLLQSAKPEKSKNFTCMALGSKQQTCCTRPSQPSPSKPPPCKPPPKPTKEKCPKPCPSPCPPKKKDPCAKLIPFFLNTIIRFDVPFDVQVPMKQHSGSYYYKNMLTDDIIERLRKLGETLRFVKLDQDTNYVKDATCARDFEPWIPIPSWPAPKVIKKRPFVCPKEGCKPVSVPRSSPPKQRPCLGVPKKFFSPLCSAPVNTPDIIFIQL